MRDPIEQLHPAVRPLIRAGFPSANACYGRVPALETRELKKARRGLEEFFASDNMVNDVYIVRAILTYLSLVKDASDRHKAAQDVERTVISTYPLNRQRTLALCKRLLHISDLDILDSGFTSRLQSYIHLAEIAGHHSQDINIYKSAVRASIRSFIRPAFTVVSIASCVHFNAELPHKLLPELFPKEWMRTYGGMELLASAMSRLIAEANINHAITPLEMVQPVAPYIYSEEFLRIVRSAMVIGEYYTARDLISLLGYCMEKLTTDTGVVYNLAPLDYEVHRFRVMGHRIRTMRDKSRGMVARLSPSLLEALETWETERCDDPYPRYRFALPLLSEPFYTDKTLTQSFESEYTRNACEELHFNDVLDLDEAKSGGTTLLQNLANLARLDMAAIVGCTAINSMPADDRDAVLNSLVHAFSDKDYTTFIDDTEDGQMRRSLDTVTWDGKGKFDIIYTPITRILDYHFLSAPIIRAARLPRNLLWSSIKDKDRYGSAPERFVKYVESLINRASLDCTATEKRIRLKSAAVSLETDLDVVLLVDSTLWFFECKFNLPSATPYEERDLLGDINKAVSQMRKAKQILEADPKRTLDWVRSWFPTRKFPNGTQFEFRGGVILSVRDYSGLSIEQIPIRDVFSLSGTLLGGSVSSALPVKDGLRTSTIHRYWKGPNFSYEDFVAYWSPSPPALAVFEECLVESVAIYREGRVTRGEHRYDLDTRFVLESTRVACNDEEHSE